MVWWGDETLGHKSCLLKHSTELESRYVCLRGQSTDFVVETEVVWIEYVVGLHVRTEGKNDSSTAALNILPWFPQVA